MTLLSIASLQTTQQTTALNPVSGTTNKAPQHSQTTRQGKDDTATFSTQGRRYAEQNLESPSTEPKFTYTNTTSHKDLKANGETPQGLLNPRMPSWDAKVDETKAEGSTKQANFTSMTRQEMLGWINTQIRSGEVSLDDSRPFMAMTMRIPVSGGLGGELPMGNDETRYNFMQKTQDGFQAALSRNDETALKMLGSAMSIMQQHQG